MQVFIKTQSSSTIGISIQPSHTVSKLKAILKEIDKSQFTNIDLKYEGKFLEDDVPLSTYHIKDGAVIQMSAITANIDRLNTTAGQFAYKSSAFKKNINSFKYELLDAINDYYPPSMALEEHIHCIEVSDQVNVALLGTDQGHIIHYDYIERKTIKTETQTEKHGVLKIAVASLTGALAIGTPKGVYVYQQEQGTLIAQTLNPVTVIKISRDGDSVYYQKEERTIEKYSVSKAKKEISFNFDGPIKAIVLSNDEKKIILGGFETQITIFSTQDGSVVHTLSDSRRGAVTCLTITSDDKLLIAASGTVIRVYNLENYSAHVFQDSHSSQINSIVTTPNNKILFSGSSDGLLTIYDLEKLLVLCYFNDFQEGGIRTMRVTDDGKTLLSAGDEGDLKLDELEQMNKHASFSTTHDAINCLANHPSDSYFVAGCKDGTITIFDDTLEEAGGSFTDIGGGQVRTIACSGELIAAGFEDLSIRVFSSRKGQLITAYDSAHTSQITGIAFSANSKLVVSSSLDRCLKIWESHGQASGPIHTYTHTDPIGAMCLSKNDEYLITASGGKNLAVLQFNQKNGKYVYEMKTVHTFFDAHDGTITSIAISPKNKYIVSVGLDYAVKVFDLERQAFLFSFLNSHKAIPNSVIISKQDQYIISTDEDGFVNFFNLPLRKHVHTDVVPNSGKILASIATTNCSKIITGCMHGKINILNNPVGSDFVTVVCGSITASSTFGYYLLKHFINDTNSSRKRGEIITKYSNLYIHPFGWNFLHLVSIFTPQIKLIDICIKEKIPFIPDQNGYTPLHYLLHFHKRDISIINYILGKFGELIQDERDLPRTIAALSNQVEEIFQYGKTQAVNFLKYAVIDPQQFAKHGLTGFGSIEKNGKSKYLIAESDVFKPELQNKLFGGGLTKLSIKIVGFKFDYSPDSKDMLRLMLTFMHFNNQEIYKTQVAKSIIDYLWCENKTFFYIPTITFSTMMILVSIYCGLPVDDRPFWLEVTILSSGGVSLIYECLATFESSLYFKDWWNAIDIALNALLIAVPIVIWTTGKDSYHSQAMLTATLFLGYFRWFSYFRVIDQTRKLTKMISEVLYDMSSFLMVLGFLTIGFALIFLQLRPDSTFGIELFKTYALIYSNYDESPDGSEIPYFVIFTVFVSVTLLNMLIAIMNETYGRVQDTSFYYENHTKASLNVEAITAKRVLTRITSNALCKKIAFCATRFRNPIARLSPERGMEILKTKFSQRAGYLYFTEEVERVADLHALGTIAKNNANNNSTINTIQEEKKSTFDLNHVESLLRQLWQENNQKIEAEKQQRKELANRVNEINEKVQKNREELINCFKNMEEKFMNRLQSIEEKCMKMTEIHQNNK